MESQIGSKSVGDFKLWSELELLEFSDRFVVRSLESPDQGFSVSRFDGDIDRLDGEDLSGIAAKASTVYGIAGMIRLLAGTYMLAITSRTEVGTYLGHSIFRVTSMKFLPCNEASKFLTSQEKKDEEYFVNLLKMVESTPGLYCSYGTDLTLCLQRRSKLGKGWKSKPIWKQSDPRFVWNRNLLEELIENKLDGFIMPLVQGSFQTGEIKLNGSPAMIQLLSRRCTRRLGTRAWRRGANLQGDTANFVETEQLLDFEGHVFSFIQVRGSIPLLWEQIADLSYKPPLRLLEHEETLKVAERHFSDLLQRYGRCIVVDLTDKHGGEGILSKVYEDEVNKISDIRYVPFDFHKFCANGRLDNIQLLYDQIADDFEKQGYFHLDSDGGILAEQEGIVRFNCIDCLDRTNVTQSFFALKSLSSQLQRVGAIFLDQCLSIFSKDFEVFRALWVDHGDEISLGYSGTHALKGDLVRYGKRTMIGNIKDGISCLSRYYLGNFQDGLRQDAIDLICGRYTISRNSLSPLHSSRSPALPVTYLPVASALVIGGLSVTTMSTINQAGRSAQSILSCMVCAGLVAGFMALVKVNGRQMCSRPRLCGLL